MKLISTLISTAICGFFSTYALAVDSPCLTDPNSQECLNFVPEPGSLWLVGIGLAGAVLVARFFKK